MRIWKSVEHEPPPENEVVETCVKDATGIRNVVELISWGALWYYPDGKLYIFCAPNHWREIVHYKL